MANIHDVARLAGVSATTAKRAIREPEKLASATLERVRRAIEQLQYEPDQLASALRSGHNNTIGLIIGSVVEPFFATLTRAIGRSIRARSYSFILADSEYRTDLELEHLKHFYGNRVSGLILRSGYGPPNLEYLLHMRQRGTAIVEVDYFDEGSPFSHVMLDNAAAIREGVRHLTSYGHRRIAALGIYHPELNTDERVRAFPEAMREQDLPLEARYRRPVPPTQQAAYELTHELMRLPTPPSALFALTGTMAIGAYRALREMRLAIPDDVSLLAFDDYPWTSLVEPGIDVLEQPVEAMGLEAVQILFGAMENRKEKVVRRRFPARLIVRGSCAPPRDTSH